MARITCPYCMRTYDAGEVLYVCPTHDLPAEPTTMERLRGRVVCKEDKCGRFATIRRCPKCSRDIPPDALVTPNLPFSIVGVKNSGKTHYITVMLHELDRASRLHVSLSAQDADTRNHQNNNRIRIYEKHERVDSTPSGEPMPQIWRIRNAAKERLGSVPTYTFTIFDGAGEDHEKLDPNSDLCRYIGISEAIILTIDPLILDGVRNGHLVDPAISLNSLAGSSASDSTAKLVLDNVAFEMKQAIGTDTRKKLKIPVAVVLTKFDTIIEQFPPNALIRQPSGSLTTGRVDEREFQQIDTEIRQWLEMIGEGAFINSLDSNFQKYQFFGVSSFGQPPKTTTTLNPIRPHRVLDPILWLFHKKRFID